MTLFPAPCPLPPLRLLLLLLQVSHGTMTRFPALMPFYATPCGYFHRNPTLSSLLFHNYTILTNIHIHIHIHTGTNTSTYTHTHHIHTHTCKFLSFTRIIPSNKSGPPAPSRQLPTSLPTEQRSCSSFFLPRMRRMCGRKWCRR
jgi:hypothetical protein